MYMNATDQAFAKTRLLCHCTLLHYGKTAIESAVSQKFRGTIAAIYVP